MINKEALLEFIGEYQKEQGKAGEVIRLIRPQLEALALLVGTVPTRLAFYYLSFRLVL
jgi:hypothetical protein